MSSMLQDPDAPVEEVPPVYFVELSKSGRAECKKCEGKIDNKTLRVGIMIDGEWGLMTRWQHLDCTVFPKTIPSVDGIDGFRELSVENKQLVTDRFDASANEVDDDSIPVNPDELVRKAWDQPLEPSSDLLMPLLPYQKEGLGWMVNQEQNEVHGGILADEMGMGKTIQAISLMLHNRPDTTEFQQMREWAASDERHGVKEELMRAGTLIVLPTVAIRQWQTEIARFTRGAALTVKVYHGSDRNTSAKELTGVDIVLTSYKILEIEYRKATAGTKVTCKLCGKKFYPDKLRVHRKYFCGEDAQRTEAQSLTQRKQQRPANAFGRPDTGTPGKGKAASSKASASKGASSTSGSARKRRKTDTAVGSDDNDDGEDEGDESSEDEVARQKREIKERKAAEEVKKAAKAAKATSAKVTAKAKAAESKSAVKAPVSAGKKVPAKSKTNASKAVVKKEEKHDYWQQPGSDGDDPGDAEGAGSEDESPVVAPRKGVPAKNGKVAAKSKSTPSKASFASASKPAGRSTVKQTATPDASAGTSMDSSAAKRRSPRTAAQVQRSYRVDTSGSDTGDAESAYDSEEAALSEQAAEEAEADASSSDSNVDSGTSDEDADHHHRAAVKGVKGRGNAKGPMSRASPSKGKQSPPKSQGSAAKARGAKGSAAASSSASKAAASSAAKAGRGKGLATAAASAVGKKRTRTMIATAESDDDGSDAEADTGAGDSDGSDSDEEEGKGAASDEDSEVERDIQEAIAEAARALAKSKAQAPKSILHMLSWFRIILDEAHLIKDRSTSTAKAVFNLVSLNKWCLTGTPLQNRVGELYSLIRFLRIDPHAFYYCRSKGCECKSLHYRFTKSKCDECSHSVIQHYCHFNKHILNPIKRAGYVSEGRRAMLKLKQQVLDEILLRRTKTTRAEDIQLPPRVVKVRQEKLDEKEEDFYSALYTQSQAQFNTYLQSGTVLNNYAHIFDILIRLRQAVDHPYLVIYSEAQTATKKDSNDFLNVSNDVVVKAEKGDCDLCHEPWEDPVTAQCGHCFCRPCITDYIAAVSNGNGSSGLRCPDCDAALTIQLNGASNGAVRGRGGSSRNSGGNGSSRSLQDMDTSPGNSEGAGAGASVWDPDKAISRRSILDKIDLSLFQSSTKIEALMEELYKMQSEDLGAKAIVFSQFVNMLDIINYRVQRGGIACVKLSGSMNLEQRDKAITAFKTDPAVKVMLISLKAGGVALNLTVASRIFLMDPWWNPAAEMQAIDRTHRIGQFKPIYATRFIIENTIEERILRLQDKKKLVFDGTVGGDAGSMSKLTVDDMRFLFN